MHGVLQIATSEVEESTKVVHEGRATLQALEGALPAPDAAALRAALQRLWQSQADELRQEVRDFVAEAAARGCADFDDVLPDDRLGTGAIDPDPILSYLHIRLFTESDRGLLDGVLPDERTGATPNPRELLWNDGGTTRTGSTTQYTRIAIHVATPLPCRACGNRQQARMQGSPLPLPPDACREHRLWH